jgi:hypothetical protein
MVNRLWLCALPVLDCLCGVGIITHPPGVRRAQQWLFLTRRGMLPAPGSLCILSRPCVFICCGDGNPAAVRTSRGGLGVRQGTTHPATLPPWSD